MPIVWSVLSGDDTVPDWPSLERVGYITLCGDTERDIAALATLVARHDKLPSALPYRAALLERADGLLADALDASEDSDWRALVPPLQKRFGRCSAVTQAGVVAEMERAEVLDDLAGLDPMEHPVTAADIMIRSLHRHHQVALYPLRTDDPLVRAICAATILAGDGRQGRSNPYLVVLYTSLEAMHADGYDPRLIGDFRASADAFGNDDLSGAIFRFGLDGLAALARYRDKEGEDVSAPDLLRLMQRVRPRGTLRSLFALAREEQRAAIAHCIEDYSQWFRGLTPPLLRGEEPLIAARPMRTS